MNSFIGWIGGKNSLKKRIISLFPTDYDCYVKVFGGAGWILFYKNKQSIEVYNDINNDLTNLFRCVKYHSEELQRTLRFVLHSRRFFDDIKNQLNYSSSLTDIQRAANFLLLIKFSYGTKLQTFDTSKINILNTVKYLDEVAKRLSDVTIENKDFAYIVDKYDKPNTLFYLDPPYYGAEKYYNLQWFNKDTHESLFEKIKDIKGKFILSYNNNPYILRLYKDYKIKHVSQINNLVNNRQYEELIITNY